MQRYNKITNRLRCLGIKRLFRCNYLSLLLLVVLLQCPSYLFAQKVIAPVKVESKKDTTKLEVDSALIRNSTFQDPINGFAEDSLVYVFGDVDTLIYFHNKGKISSMSMDMEADYLVLSKKNRTIFGTGVRDTANTLQGRPVFKNEGEEYSMDTITYNYSSKKARILNVFTKQGDGLLYGDVSKRMQDNSTFIKGAKYTTCDHPHPHFYIKMTKGKIVDNPKNIYFGPSYLVIEDVPFPLILPFGFFPQMSSRSSGLRMPSYGEEVSRGFFLRNLGYYIAVGDYMDLDILADYYTMGSWALRSNSRYTKRYKFSGNFNLEYASNVTGEKGAPDYTKATSFSVRWSHTQSPKARPGTTFSANVNFSSINNKDYLNGRNHNAMDNLQNSINSSISYSKSWAGKPYSFSMNASHSQNMRDSSYSVTLPNFTFSLSRIKPFERKERVGKKAFYEDIAFTYSATFDNKANFKESEIADIGKKITNGLNHNINITLPNFSVAKYINIAPNVRYNTKWFFKKAEQHWDSIAKRVVTDTTSVFSHLGTTHEYSFGASASTQIYGMLRFKKGSMIEAVRHVLKPSISVNYNPDLKKGFNGWKQVQVDSLGTMRDYNIYANQVYGPPGQTESGSIGFNLGNNLEMKVRNRKDTSGVKKMAIFNTFDISTSYNLLADSLNLADIQFRGSTNLPGQTAVSFNFTLDPYQIDDRGRKINKIRLLNGGGLGLLTNFGFSFGHSFSGGGSSSGKLNNPTGVANTDNDTEETENKDINRDDDHSHDHEKPNPLKYETFKMPWNLSFNFSYNYRNTPKYQPSTQSLIMEKTHSPTLNFSGSISPTENWDLRLNSGFDIKLKKLTTTQISIARKLHCFDFSFNWTPLGRFQSWSFNIAISSSMLSDILKYDKQSSYMDNR